MTLARSRRDSRVPREYPVTGFSSGQVVEAVFSRTVDSLVRLRVETVGQLHLLQI